MPHIDPFFGCGAQRKTSPCADEKGNRLRRSAELLITMELASLAERCDLWDALAIAILRNQRCSANGSCRCTCIAFGTIVPTSRIFLGTYLCHCLQSRCLGWRAPGGTTAASRNGPGSDHRSSSDVVHHPQPAELRLGDRRAGPCLQRTLVTSECISVWCDRTDRCGHGHLESEHLDHGRNPIH